MNENEKVANQAISEAVQWLQEKGVETRWIAEALLSCWIAAAVAAHGSDKTAAFLRQLADEVEERGDQADKRDFN